jgi:hypothetical protein
VQNSIVSFSVRGLLAFAAGALAVFLLLKYAPSTTEHQRVVRIYKVPANQLEPIEAALSETLVGLTRIHRGPNGDLIVAASESVHKDIAKLLEEIGKTSPDSIATVQFDIWFIAANGAGLPATDAKFQPIALALKQLAGDSNTKFELRGHSSVRAVSGADGKGEDFQVKPVVIRDKDGAVKIVADLNMQAVRSKRGEQLQGVRTRLALVPGEIVVVGQASSADGQETLYHLVRASL